MLLKITHKKILPQLSRFLINKKGTIYLRHKKKFYNYSEVSYKLKKIQKQEGWVFHFDT